MQQRPVRQVPVPQAPAKKGDEDVDVLDRIADLSFDPTDGLNFTLYGESGTGKTTLWSSFPGPILAMICSGGQKPGELRSIDCPEMREKVSTVVLRRCSELDTIVRAITKGDLLHKSGKPFETLVLDHVSGFQDMKLAEYKNLRKIPQQKTYGVATRQDWGEITSQCKEHLIGLMSVKGHVVNIAQERIFLPNSDDPAGEIKKGIELSDVIKPKVGAALTPALTGWLNPASDYVLQTFIRQRQVVETKTTKIAGKVKESSVTRILPGVDYCARVARHEIFMGKFRVWGAKDLPEAIVLGDSVNGVKTNPSGFEQIMSIINSGRE